MSFSFRQSQKYVGSQKPRRKLHVQRPTSKEGPARQAVLVPQRGDVTRPTPKLPPIRNYQSTMVPMNPPPDPNRKYQIPVARLPRLVSIPDWESKACSRPPNDFFHMNTQVQLERWCLYSDEHRDRKTAVPIRKRAHKLVPIPGAQTVQNVTKDVHMQDTLANAYESQHQDESVQEVTHTIVRYCYWKVARDEGLILGEFSIGKPPKDAEAGKLGRALLNLLYSCIAGALPRENFLELDVNSLSALTACMKVCEPASRPASNRSPRKQRTASLTEALPLPLVDRETRPGSKQDRSPEEFLDSKCEQMSPFTESKAQSVECSDSKDENSLPLPADITLGIVSDRDESLDCHSYASKKKEDGTLSPTSHSPGNRMLRKSSTGSNDSPSDEKTS